MNKAHSTRSTLDERVGPEQLTWVSELLRTASHPHRLAILDVLGTQGRLCNSEIQERLNLEQAILSQHLTLMRDKGLLNCAREGKFTFWELSLPEFLNIIRSLEHCCKGTGAWK